MHAVSIFEFSHAYMAFYHFQQVEEEEEEEATS
jgi:hypothetical protein